MPIEFKCPFCAQHLRVKDELAGKPVSCPMCKQVAQVPGQAPQQSPPQTPQQTPQAPQQPTPQATPPTTPQPTPTPQPKAKQPTQKKPDPPDQFRVQCGNCGKAIRVPKAMGGKKGACPSCKVAFMIPMPPGSAPAAPSQPIQQVPDPNVDPLNLDPLASVAPAPIDPLAQDPFAADPLAQDPFAQDPMGLNNPMAPQMQAPIAPLTPGQQPVQASYLAQQAPPPPARTRPRTHKYKARRELPGSAVATKVFGIIMIAAAVINIMFWGFFLLSVVSSSPAELEANMERRYSDASPETLWAGVLGIGIVALLGCVFHGYCGVEMFLLRNWNIAIVGSIATLLPCCCYTWLFTLPVGIVSLILLFQDSVKEAFKDI